MTRNVSTQSIVFGVRYLAENNATVTLLCRDYGIVYSTLFGGPKSKLRSRVSQFNSGIAHLYCSHTGNVESGVKITDFEVANYHLSFRECIYKNFAASVAAEIAVATRCAGSNEECFVLVSSFMDGLEATSGEHGGAALRASMVRFLWRYLELLGLRPDCGVCVSCGGSTADGAVYDNTEDGFVCLPCAKDDEVKGMHLSPMSMAYLSAVSHEAPAVSRGMELDLRALQELKSLTFMLVQKAVDRPLKSIKSGVGIL